jgi:hypothetical protein
MKELVLLSADPGTANYGFAVIAVPQPHLRSSLSKFKVLQYGRIHNTVRSLKENIGPQVLAHSTVLLSLKERFGAHAFIAERYQSRRMGGVTIECVNLMLGVALSAFSRRPVKVLPASQWKNAAARAELWFDELYTSLKPHGVTPHAIDAVCIGLYGLGMMLKAPSPFHFVNVRQLQSKLLKAEHIDLGEPPPKTPRKTKKAKRGPSRNKLLPYDRRKSVRG